MRPALQRLAAPMLIEPQWLRVMVGIASRGKFDASAVAQAKAEWEARRAAMPATAAAEPGAPVEGTGDTLRIVGSVGVLSVEGPLFRHADLFTSISGGTSYESLWKGLEAALANPRITAILLRVNSPGGEADGCNELAKGIAAAAAHKPVWAYADNLCASAAYWLASQADHIVTEETAELGSIGVRCGIVDDSERDAQDGIRDIEIISSQSPGKRSRPVDDEVVSRLQTRVDDLAQIFVEAVARGRGVEAQDVLEGFGQGDVMIAAKAVDAGLADEIGNFNSALAALAAHSMTTSTEARAAARTQRKVTTMAKSQTPRAASDEDEDKTIKCAECEEPMHDDAEHYCKSCYAGDDDEDHEEPDGDEDESDASAIRGFGLLGKTRAQTRANLVGFVKGALAASGSKDAASALGAIKANAEAATQLAEERTRRAAEAKSQAKANLTGAVKAAIFGGKITLAEGAGLVDFLPDAEAAKVRAELDKPETPTTADALLGAFALAEPDERAVKAITSYLAKKGAAFQPPHREPRGDKEDVVTAAIDPEAARKFGIDPKKAERLMNVNSVADLRRAKKGA